MTALATSTGDAIVTVGCLAFVAFIMCFTIGRD